MAIANYSDLNTAVANWLARSDLTSRIPEGIVLAEAKMNRRLREKEMVTRDSSFALNDEVVNVPANFGGVKHFWLNTTPRVVLDYMPISLITYTYQDRTTGHPRHYAVEGSVFRFGPPLDANYTATLVYYLKVPALTASATTNWMITNHPDAYLYGVLAEMCGLAKDPTAEKWLAMMYQVIDEIKRASNRDTYGGDGVLAARPG